MRAHPTAAVIGGGFSGCMLAERLARGGMDVVLLEREGDLLLRASLANQARVHGGYHYPRSLLTGLRSRANLPRFVAEFPDCIDGSFTKLDAIAARHSHVTARHFVGFFGRLPHRDPRRRADRPGPALPLAGNGPGGGLDARQPLPAHHCAR